ncbi:nucleotidyltransferase family protein [Luteimicrobium sp. DT211]|uniref:nucleotidyltransferase family protein n=1 Tax=Luteimicrobium sp. DT211 TaxID=3393412 RepID=UPI003CF2F1BA
MEATLSLDRDRLARICAAHGVRRLRLFGSAVSGGFNPLCSDYDFLVEFEPGADHPFDRYFDLKEDLEALVGREVDLVMSDAVRNPYFAASAGARAELLYAA